VNILSARQPVGRGRSSLVLVDRAFFEDGGRVLRLVNAGASSVDVAGSPVEVVDSLVEVEEFAEGLEHTTGFVTLEAEVIQGMASGTSKYGNKMWTVSHFVTIILGSTVTTACIPVRRKLEIQIKMSQSKDDQAYRPYFYFANVMTECCFSLFFQ